MGILHDITEAIPMPIGVPGGAAALSDERYHVSLASMGFMLSADQSTPYQRANDTITKTQVDQSNEAGEQSLGSWWVRSQASWHLGAGLVWYDPGKDATTEFRYATSQGVDVWTQGKFALLPAVVADGASSASAVYTSTCRKSNLDGYVYVAGTSAQWRSTSGTVTATLPGTGVQPAVGGGVVWIPCGTAGIVKWDYTTGTKTAAITGTIDGCWWVKNRLIVASGPNLYACAATYTGAITAADSAAHYVVYTHASSTFKFVDVAETSDAIIAAGGDGTESIVVAMTVTNDADTGVPVLASGKEVARMPAGEQIACMGTYLSGFIALGTTLGIRIGITGTGGAVQYGPLTVRTGSSVVDVTFWDRFAYFAVTNAFPDGTSGVARVDLSQQIGDSTSQYAWAWDVGPGVTGTATSVCFYGNTGRSIVAIAGQPYLASATALVESGYLDMGQVRYGTTENKAFRYARANGALNGGTVQVLALDQRGVEHSLITYGGSTGIGQDALIAIAGLTLTSYLGFRVRLTPDDTVTTAHPAPTSPVISGIGIKALPAPKPPRLYQFPLSCFDFEDVADTGETLGWEGRAWYAVQALEAVQDSAVPLFVQDRRTGETFVAVIDQISFTGVTNPDRNRPNFGGTLTVQLRAI